MVELLDKKNTDARNEYELFVSNHPTGNFLQSLKWTDVKINWEWEAVVSRDNEGKINGAALILIKRIPVLNVSFFYCAHGPVCDYNDKQTMADIFAFIKKLGKKYKAYQFMFDPYLYEKETDTIKSMMSLGFKHVFDAPELSTIQPRNNYVLDIKGKTPEEVFANFHKKWRYNIRVAEKNGVVCKVCGTESLDDFMKLYEETGKRDGFAVRSKEYFIKMMNGLGENCRLFICYMGDIPLSGAVTTQYAGKTCYVYGASTSEHRNAMPNYLMQWTMIQWAFENGGYLYDFQGIPFYKDETHPNYGVYRFKKGFNGEVVTFAGEFTVCYNRFIKILADTAQGIRKVVHHFNLNRVRKMISMKLHSKSKKQ